MPTQPDLTVRPQPQRWAPGAGGTLGPIIYYAQNLNGSVI